MSTVENWMKKFFLLLNTNKTKIMVFAPPAIIKNLSIHGTFVGNTAIRFVTTAKNLGVWFDNELHFRCQITKKVSSSYMTLREIGKIKQYIPNDMLKTLLTSLIFQKIDYCNSLYYGIEKNEIKKLQSVQNTAVRMLKNFRKFDRIHISPILLELHWLKVEKRIIFKLCLIVYKCILQDAPDPLKSLLTISNPRTFVLLQKKYNSKYGKRAFSCAAPMVWNQLPISIRSEYDQDKFKKGLKTHLMFHE